MMPENVVEARVDGATGWILLTRPQARNALTVQSFVELHRAIDAHTANEAVKSIIIMGKGGVFSSGRDFKDRDVPEDFERLRSDAFSAIEYCPKPTIAAVGGYAITGGMTLALCCDIVVAADDAVFQDTHAKLGAITLRVSRVYELLGPLFTKELMFTGRRVGAAEALSMGMVNRVVPAANLKNEAASIAKQINAHETAAVQAIKQVINDVVRDDQRRFLELEERAKRRFNENQPETVAMDKGIAIQSKKGGST